MASKLTPAQRVALARHPERPGTADFIKHLFTDFFEQRGDRLCAENGSILGGVALFHGKPVTVIGHRKGRSLEENLSLHFGMPSPEGYRKAQRLIRNCSFAMPFPSVRSFIKKTLIPFSSASRQIAVKYFHSCFSLFKACSNTNRYFNFCSPRSNAFSFRFYSFFKDYHRKRPKTSCFSIFIENIRLFRYNAYQRCTK